MLTTIQVKDAYAQVLQPLEPTVDEVVKRLAIERASQQIVDLKQKVQAWEKKYGCTYDLFAYRTATDEGYVVELDTNPVTTQWEGDLLEWEFYATELQK